MLFVTGDTHMPIDVSKLNAKRFPRQKILTKEDFVIICGDFGAVWDNGGEDRYWRKWLDDRNFTTLFVDGNHENFDLLSQFPVMDFHGGQARRVGKSIYHLMRGEVFTFGGNTFFAMGGAASADRALRKEGVSWWAEELPGPEAYAHARERLASVDWQVDIVLTHCAPSDLQVQIAPELAPNQLTDFLQQVRERCTYRHWYFGHYHRDQALDEKHQVLYQQVLEIS